MVTVQIRKEICTSTISITGHSYQQPICTGSTQLQSHPLQYKRSIQKGEIRSEEEEEEEKEG
jgi:hypothetical protein